MINRYLQCKDRFRVYAIDGLRPQPVFNHFIEYGQMWHICEEMHAGGKDWMNPLKKYAAALAVEYRTEQEQVNKWYNVVKAQFPVYLDYWEDHDDESDRIPLLQEYTFNTPYVLPSGRIVKLRGKMDGVDLIEGEGIYLQENKTKSKIDVQSLERQLTCDLQTMMYVNALEWSIATAPEDTDVFDGDVWEEPVLGVRYNVIKRALSGGTGTIRQHKPTKKNPAGESAAEFYARLQQVIRDNQDDFFARWKVTIANKDRNRFKDEVLNPILENMCDDYEWWCFCKEKDEYYHNYLLRAEQFDHTPCHFRLPYGLYNVVMEGGFAEIDNYITTGSTVGLCNSTDFFHELDV